MRSLSKSPREVAAALSVWKWTIRGLISYSSTPRRCLNSTPVSDSPPPFFPHECSSTVTRNWRGIFESAQVLTAHAQSRPLYSVVMATPAHRMEKGVSKGCLSSICKSLRLGKHAVTASKVRNCIYNGFEICQPPPIARIRADMYVTAIWHQEKRWALTNRFFFYFVGHRMLSMCVALYHGSVQLSAVFTLWLRFLSGALKAIPTHTQK